jgi:hypothetical protein
MQIWFKMVRTQSHLRTSFQNFSIVFPFLLIELRYRVSLTLYRPIIYRLTSPEVLGHCTHLSVKVHM